MNGKLRDLISRIIAWSLGQEESIEVCARTIIGAAIDEGLTLDELRRAIDWHAPAN